jgi:hypothetical protein
MQRWHKDIQVMKRQKRIWDKFLICYDGVEDKNLGRFRKKHALDCGKSGCLLCHSDKQLYKSRKEQEVDLKFREQIRDLEV